MESVASQLSTLLRFANLVVGLGPFVAGVIVALMARKSHPRAAWLAFAGCLVVLVSDLGYEVFLAASSAVDLGVDTVDLVDGAVGVFDGLLGAAGVTLLVLAIATMLRADRVRRAS